MILIIKRKFNHFAYLSFLSVKLIVAASWFSPGSGFLHQITGYYDIIEALLKEELHGIFDTVSI